MIIGSSCATVDAANQAAATQAVVEKPLLFIVAYSVNLERDVKIKECRYVA